MMNESPFEKKGDLRLLFDSFSASLIHHKSNAVRYALKLSNPSFADLQVERGIGERYAELEYLDRQIEPIVREDNSDLIIIDTRNTNTLRFVQDRYYPSIICGFNIKYLQENIGYFWFTFDSSADFRNIKQQDLKQLILDLELAIPDAINNSITALWALTFTSIFDKVKNPIVLLNQSSLIAFNKAAKVMIEKNPENTQILLNIIPVSDEQTMKKRVMLNGVSYELETTFIEDKLVGRAFVLILYEITSDLERKKEFQSVALLLSDRFNKIISEMNNQIQILKLFENFSPDVQNLLNQFTNKLKDANSFINQLQNMIISEKKELPLDAININEILRKVIDDASELIEQRQINIELKCEQNIPVIKASRAFLELGLTNVFDIVVKTAALKTSILVNVVIQEKNILIQINNFGNGINATDIEHLWDEYYEFSTNLLSSMNENNLKLLIAQNLFVKHNGDITISSQPGRGMQISLRLPIA